MRRCAGLNVNDLAIFSFYSKKQLLDEMPKAAYVTVSFSMFPFLSLENLINLSSSGTDGHNMVITFRNDCRVSFFSLKLKCLLFNHLAQGQRLDKFN